MTSRALYGVAQAHEPETAAQDNESIEDPLQDWLDDEDALRLARRDAEHR